MAIWHRTLAVSGLGAALLIGGCQRQEPVQTQAAPGGTVDHSLLTKVLEQYVNEDGMVDYRGLRENRGDLDAYLELLAGTDPESLRSRDEKLAYWINAYNATTLQYVLDEYPLASVKDVNKGGKDFWHSREFTLGGREYLIDAIENEVIRPRFEEPRIHFVLVCAAMGCPRLEAHAFTGQDLEQRLETATRRFVNNPGKNRVDVAGGKLHLSSIFKWYAPDFEKAAGSVKAYVRGYLD
ncbi:MAG: DUF547 domain-containing protein, partial [Armatimonadota bacterium]